MMRSSSSVLHHPAHKGMQACARSLSRSLARRNNTIASLLLPRTIMSSPGASDGNKTGSAAPRASAAAAGAAASTSGQQQRQPVVTDLAPMLLKVKELNNGTDALASLVPFVVDGATLGRMRPEFAAKLLAAGAGVFVEAAGDGGSGSSGVSAPAVTLAPHLSTRDARTAAVAPVLERLRDEGAVRGWRGEMYPLARAFDAPPALLVERAAAPYFGMRSYGVHVNGYVVDPDGTKRLWVARRSRSKHTWPGKLDHIVAGGQPFGISPSDNVVKECGEEASVPPEVAARAVATGFISYVSLLPEGLKPDVLYCYDLELPAGFRPRPQDGEVEEFMLWDLAEVARVVATTDEYKPNCGVVVMDFLVRHGYITPDMPGYTALVAGMRVGDPA